MLGDDKVFIIHNSPHWYNEHRHSQKAWLQNEKWKNHEPRVFEVGSLEPSLFWTIMERLKVIPYKERESQIDDDLYEIIIEVDSSVYNVYNNYYNLKKYKPSRIPTEEIFAESIGISNEAMSNLKFNSEQILKVVSITEAFELKYNWISDLSKDISFKILTDRNGDLHSGNLGFRLCDSLPLFFDW